MWIVPAVEPDIAALRHRGHRPRLQPLHPRRPRGRARAAEDRFLRYADGIAEQLHRHRCQRRVRALVFADQREVFRHRVDEMRLQPVERRAFGRRLLGNHIIADLALDRREDRAPLLDDAGLFARNRAQVGAEEGFVVKVHRRDHRQGRRIDHVGRIEPAAQADLENEEVRRHFGESEDRRRRGRLEMRDLPAADCLERPVEPADQARIVHQLPRQPDAFVEAHQMRRGKHVHGQSGRFGHRAHEGAGGPFAVGPRHMDDRRQPVLRTAQCIERRKHAPERKLDDIRIKTLEPLQRGVERRTVTDQSAAPFGWGSLSACVFGGVSMILDRSSRRRDNGNRCDSTREIVAFSFLRSQTIST